MADGDEIQPYRVERKVGIGYVFVGEAREHEAAMELADQQVPGMQVLVVSQHVIDKFTAGRRRKAAA